MVRLILAGFALLLAALAGFVFYRASTFTAPPLPVSAQAADLGAYDIDAAAAATRLGQAIRFQTVSLVNASDDRAHFQQFHAWMAETYPAFHALARRQVIGEFSLLYTWQGSDPAQPPLLLLAHQDVVPAAPETRADWSVDPFGGVIRDNAVWGRGAVDDKGSLVALLEAAEYLARAGAKPTRTIILAFGHDEEIGGEGGAALIAADLASRGVRAWFALDEGMIAVASHPFTGGPAALIGVAEKGGATMRVTATAPPGHSSMPPPQTAVSTLALAVGRIHSMPIERSLEGGPALDMLRALAPGMSLINRVAVSNEWLFGVLLQERMQGNPTALALMGTSVAPTMINGGVRPNVLPSQAVAMINFRIHPRDSTEDLLARARAAVADLEGVNVEWEGFTREASPVSSATSSSFALLAGLSRQILPEAPVAPALVIAGTDSRLYADVAENVYRFQPIQLTNEETQQLHGLNERLSIVNLERMIRFYIGVMETGAMQ